MMERVGGGAYTMATNSMKCVHLNPYSWSVQTPTPGYYIGVHRCRG